MKYIRKPEYWEDVGYWVMFVMLKFLLNYQEVST